MDYNNKPKATAIDPRFRSAADNDYHEEIKGKVQNTCETCGHRFWSEKKRRVCSVDCMRSLP